MEDFSRCFGLNRTLALICCIFYIFLQADGNRLFRPVGSPVMLQCDNNSIIKFTQLTWKRNEVNLFTFRAVGTSNSSCVTLKNSQITSNIRCIRSPAAAKLNLNMSTSESSLYALIIESAQKTHTGNYTCETSMAGGVLEEKWELVITEETELLFEIYAAVAVIVPCVCFLIFIITALIILKRVCKQCSQNTSQSPPVISGQQEEDVYENTLELEARHRHSQIQAFPDKCA